MLGNASAIVTMTPASVGVGVISNLNGSLVSGQHKLTVKPYERKKSKSDSAPPEKEKQKKKRTRRRKKKDSGAESAGPKLPSPPDIIPVPISPPSICRVFVGSKLPEYTNEQHIKDHFRAFSSSILNVELVRDRRTNAFKGFGFVVFSNDASAQMAISTLDKTTLLGVRIRVSVDTSKGREKQQGVPASTTPLPPSPEKPTFNPQGTDDLSDSESVCSNVSAHADSVKVVIHSRPKLPNLSPKVFMAHFKEFASSITGGFVVKDRNTKKSCGFGFLFFSSLETAQLAVHRMQGTKLQGKYQLISLSVEGKGGGGGKMPQPPSNVAGKGIRLSEAPHGHPPSSGTNARPLHAIPRPQALPQSHPQLSSSHTVVVRNLDPSVGESEVRSLVNVSMLSFTREPPPSNQVLIKFYYAADAEMAVDALNNRNVVGQVVQAFVQPQAMPPTAQPALERSHSNPAMPPFGFVESHPPSQSYPPMVLRSQHSVPAGPSHQPQGQPGYNQPPPPQPYPQGYQHLSGRPHPPGPPTGQPHPPGPQGYPPGPPAGQPYHPGPQGYSGPVGQPHPPGPPSGQPHPPGPPAGQFYHLGPPAGQPLPPAPQSPAGHAQPPGSPAAQPRPPGAQATTPTKSKSSATSVKVTHLPPTITKEKLHQHFSMVGEIKGEPAIHITAKTKFAHVNFHDPQVAQNAVSHLDGSAIDGVTITVKLQNKKPKAKEASEEAEEESGGREKVMKLEDSQWNALMMASGGSSLFKEITAPFRSNPNVVMTPVYEEHCIKFTGTPEAVQDAFSFLKKHLNREIHIKR